MFFRVYVKMNKLTQFPQLLKPQYKKACTRLVIGIVANSLTVLAFCVLNNCSCDSAIWRRRLESRLANPGDRLVSDFSIRFTRMGLCIHLYIFLQSPHNFVHHVIGRVNYHAN